MLSVNIAHIDQTTVTAFSVAVKLQAIASTEHLKNKILYPHKFFQENLHDVAVNHLGEGKNGHGENTGILSIYKQWLTLATYCYNAVILLLLLFGVREWKKRTVAKSKCLVGIENKESIEEIKIKRCLH